MAGKPKISDAMAARAIATMGACEDGTLDEPDHRIRSERCRSANNLHTHWMQQERYALNQQSPADYERAVRSSRHSLAAKHDRLTPEDVLELQASLVGDAYPGKPA